MLQPFTVIAAILPAQAVTVLRAERDKARVVDQGYRRNWAYSATINVVAQCRNTNIAVLKCNLCCGKHDGVFDKDKGITVAHTEKASA